MHYDDELHFHRYSGRACTVYVQQRTKAIVPPLADPEIIATRAIAIVFILGMSECHRVCSRAR